MDAEVDCGLIVLCVALGNEAPKAQSQKAASGRRSASVEGNRVPMGQPHRSLPFLTSNIENRSVATDQINCVLASSCI